MERRGVLRSGVKWCEVEEDCLSGVERNDSKLITLEWNGVKCRIVQNILNSSRVY